MTEKVGRHKGAVETLLHEKKELSRLLQIVNSQLERHLGALDEAGVDTDQFIQDIQQEGQEQAQKKKQKQVQNSRQSSRNSQGSTQKRKQNSNRNSGNKSGNRRSRNRGSNTEEEESGDRDFNPL
jgi:hypothetical protein